VNDNYSLAGYLTHDEMKGYLLLEKKQADLKLDETSLLEKIASGGMFFGVDPDAVHQCLVRVSTRGGAQLLEIAAGRRPEDGSDGTIEFYIQPSSEEARYTKDASGRINYQELNLIENVAADQEVARLLPPRPGVPGSTVTGREITPRSGSPVRARAGKGVRLGGVGDVFIAEIPGRLVYADDTLSISQDYEVKGDVDYSVGNVDFVGRVVVHGEVLDDFRVRGLMGIEIRGAVGKCQLVSDGDIVLASGMNGKAAGSVKAGGKVRARYLNEVTVEAVGDIQVEREAYNAVARTAGVFTAGGKTVGGEITALRGIELAVAGSELGVSTKLVAGTDFRRSERIREINARTAAVDKEIDRISTAIGPLLADPKRVALLPADKKKVVLALVGHLRTLKEQREGYAAQMLQVDADDATAVRQVNIRERLFPSVIVEVGANRLLMKSQSTGPLSLVEDLLAGTVRIVAYAPLGAARIEPTPGAVQGGTPPAFPSTASKPPAPPARPGDRGAR
ncbi:MAG TPA: FapA family protein, partial [Planctomycetota bacterium]|nr:FapA family protein [Planctomycetota bacterium]